MKKTISFLLIVLIVFTVLPAVTKSDVVVGFSLVQTLGISGDDFVGSISLSEANFYEDYFNSKYLFPMQGICALPNGKIALIDNSYGRIHILNGFLENEDAFGANANLLYPTDIAFYSGKFYVADALGNKVAVFGKSGDFIESEFKKPGRFPVGIAVNKNGIYVSYYFEGKIVRYSFSGAKLNEVSVRFPGGLASNGNSVYAVSMSERAVYIYGENLNFKRKIASRNLIFPSDVAVDNNGNIYVADRGLSKGVDSKGRVVKFDSNGNFVSFIGSPAESYPDQKDGTFLTPCGIAFSNGNLFVMDAGYYYWDSRSEAPFGAPIGARLSVFDTSGIFLGKKDYRHNDVLVNPLDATLDSSGHIWVVNFGGMDQGSLVEYSSSGEFVRSVSSIGGSPVSYPYSVFSDKNGHILLGTNGAIYVLNNNGHLIKTIKSSSIGIVKKITKGKDGLFYATLLDKDSVLKFSIQSGIISFYPVCKDPSGIAQDKNGNFYITSLDDNKIYVYSPAFHKKEVFGSDDPASSEHFSIPEDVGIDEFGNIVVTDTEGGRLVVLNKNGALVYSSPRIFYEPCSIEFEDGMLIVSDCFHNVVKILNEDTKSETYAFFASVYPAKSVVRPGQEAKLSVSINNAGAKKEQYFVTVEKNYPPDWSITLSGDSLTLAPGESGSITISVTPPENAADGDSVKLNITVSSPEKSVTLKAVVTVSTKLPPELTVPDTKLMRGDIATIQIIAEGLKNASDLSFIAYVPNGISVVSVSAGNMFADALTLSSVKPGKVVFAVSEKGGKWKTGSGVIATISVKGNSISKGTIRFSDAFCTNPVGERADFEVKSGLIEVTPYLSVNFSDGIKSDVQNFSFTGKTDPGTSVFVNDQRVPVNSDGTFTATVVLNGVENEIVISAVAKGGETTVIKRKVIFTGKKRIVIKLQIGNPMMTVNGVEMEIDPGRGTKPFIKKGWNRTLVPIRAIVEALGGTIGWEPKSRMVWIVFNATEINMWINNPMAKVNGTPVWIDPSNHKVCPIIVNDRTFVPIRFVAESLGCTVLWDAKTKTVTISYEE